MRLQKIKAAANGNWCSIYAHLAIDVPKRGKQGPCPLCGGVDRFHYDDLEGRGTWHCRKCDGQQAGDGFSLVASYYGVSFNGSLELVARAIGMEE
ncbi:primase-helicase zinc-binding domain-containing protein [Ferrimonas aestuarii]|uniref:DNA primase/helicase Gp4 N-terminal Bacteriophage T7-like domain-containing protein n=1 Tax=Ferrimonas aestuarii TaxID=2569539 RepID=A0A4U1BT59_9GAMM|nr:primase-helicase zinc-binding domain-containing protein [Ferrimonas aestuarii]TKB58362.1 hypothetical protein FCL42_01025 [Ferrimonas aestuarii]